MSLCRVVSLSLSLVLVLVLVMVLVLVLLVGAVVVATPSCPKNGDDNHLAGSCDR